MASACSLPSCAPPLRLDPGTLQTLGLEDFGGTLRAGLPFRTGLPWADAAAGVLLTGLRTALTGRWSGWVRLGGWRPSLLTAGAACKPP
jgi:carotenoid cleavage dioxygenase-like enzyme